MKEGCPICKKSMHSDITAEACRLCGMPLEKSSTVRWRAGDETFLFCCQRCCEQFKTQEVTT